MMLDRKGLMIFRIWAVSLVVSTMAVGCGESDDFRGERVRILDFQYQQTLGGSRMLSGRLENLSPEDIPVAQIQISLFDADNRRISSTYIIVRDIQAGDSTFFKEPIDTDLDVRGARVRTVLIL